VLATAHLTAGCATLRAPAGEVMLGDLFREGFDITVRSRARYATAAAALDSGHTHVLCRLRTRMRTPSL
jgi:hypothetical protein